MKLQIQAQNLRFRIDKAELGRLLSGESVENVTHLGEGTTFGQSVRLAEMDVPTLAAQNNHVALTLPRAWVADYARRLPSRAGIEFTVPIGSDAHILELAFEVDVRDSVRVRRAEREQGPPSAGN